MIWLVLLGAIGLALAVYFTIESVRRKRGAVSDPVDHVFYEHVIEINLKNPDGTNRQDIISHCHKGEELVLVPEPDNPRHPDAVEVCCKNGQQIGYLPTDNGRMAQLRRCIALYLDWK